jgi:PAS domain-containing protein
VKAEEDSFERWNGAILWQHWEVWPWYTSDGAVGGIVIFTEDITARQSAQAALRVSEEKYRQIVELAQEGIWVIDAENRTLFANARMAEMLGYTVDEMHGQPLFAFMDDENRKLAEADVERRRQGITEQHEFVFRRKDGTPPLDLSGYQSPPGRAGTLLRRAGHGHRHYPAQTDQVAEHEQRMWPRPWPYSQRVEQRPDLDTVMTRSWKTSRRWCPRCHQYHADQK